ncbi:hypothetical protein JOB18_019115 [Solea senegalensis]|uniref:Synaptopodin 2b n=1 Tax=Solea senegalensis TaxID=28829 RepID=A0AAV6Q868_SOLSE|nr:synaptopodin-2 [Solea senegalensis]KAG7485818.1 hypothetical protein JOB18_019115 [Solea senegalensis]
MEVLPGTKGKGVLMFVQRRKRMDEIVSDHEEMKSKGLPVRALTGPRFTETQKMYDTKQMYMHTDQANYQVNVSRPLVPNRTAKPFLGFQDGTAHVNPGSVTPVMKRNEPKFKVPVPTNTNPHVWSPTGDIIASRDERISVPAIMTGILPGSKRKTARKQVSARAQESDPYLQNKGERRSYIEPEEDCFSLGAEACNFMQTRSTKLKNPPPVAPKPVINPSCPPWVRRSPPVEPHIPPRSPVSQPSHSSGGPHSQHYSLQQDGVQSQQMVNRWTPGQTLQPAPTNALALVNTSSQLHHQSTTYSRNQQLPRSPVSTQTPSSTYRPYHPPFLSRNQPDSVPNSVASCPPQAYIHASKTLQASPKGQVSERERGIYQSVGESAMVGKGAQLFAKRQSRMEKFVVDAETVEAHKTRPHSPSFSLPNSWGYSSNIRAPPPLQYNPLLSPHYTSSAARQTTSTSSKTTPKTKEKPKVPTKHLNPLDIMKHQPYQLDTSLFKFEENAKSPNSKPTPLSKFEVTKSLKQRAAYSHSPYKSSEISVLAKAEAPHTSPGLVSSSNSSAHQNTRSAGPLTTGKHLDEKHTVTPAVHHISNTQAPSAKPASTSSQQSPSGSSIASAYSPASLIARGVRQMAPRPKFSAKKPAAIGKQWKTVAVLH